MEAKTNNKFFADVFYILVTNGLTYLVSMLTTRIISTSFSLSDYGFRSQVLTTVTLLVSIFSFGMPNCPNFFLPQVKDQNKKDKISINIYFVCFSICVVMSVFVNSSFDLLVSYFHNDQLYKCRYVIMFLPVARIIYSLYSGMMIAQCKAFKSAVVSCLRAFALVLATCILCIFKQSILLVLIVTMVIEFVCMLYTVYNCVPLDKRWFKLIHWNIIRKLLAFGIPLGLSLMVGTLCSQIDKLFISRLLTVEDLAIYTNMSAELPLAAISGAFIAISTPYIVQLISTDKVQEAVNLWGRITEFAFIFLAFIISFLLVFSKEAIIVLYSEAYVIGHPVFKVFILLEVCRLTYFGLLLRSSGKSNLILLCSVLTLITNVILNTIFYFIFSMGLIGFAWATFISSFSMQFFQLALSSKLLKIKFGSIFPWRHLGKITAINGLFMVTASWGKNYLFTHLTWNTIIIAALIGLVWGVIYLIVCWERIMWLYNKTKTSSL